MVDLINLLYLLSLSQSLHQILLLAVSYDLPIQIIKFNQEIMGNFLYPLSLLTVILLVNLKP